MGRIVRAAAASLAAAILLTGCSAPSLSRGVGDYEPPEEYTGFEPYTIEQQFDYEKYSSWYPQFVADMQSGEVSPVIGERVSGSDLDLAVKQFNTDCPDVFWLRGYTEHPKGDQVRLDFWLLDGMEEEDVIPMHEELVSAAQELIDSIPEGYSDYEKLLYAHDYIAKKCVYDDSDLHETVSGLWGTAYGCLVQGNAVCQGYANAMQYIMNLLGIEGGVCSGYAYNGTSHAWNYAVVDGTTAWIDVTWDDTGSEISHGYFMFDDEHMLRTRWLDKSQNYAPECSTMDRSWAEVNGCYFTEYSLDGISEYMDGISGSAELMFADYDSYRAALDDLLGDGRIWELPGIDGSVRYQRDDRMYYLRIYR